MGSRNRLNRNPITALIPFQEKSLTIAKPYNAKMKSQLKILPSDI